jgi:soluble lytic murein transglycosylase-like protein
MFNRLSSSTFPAEQKAGRSDVWAIVARDTAHGFMTTAHHMLVFLGVAAICVLAITFIKPDFADRLKTLSPFSDKVDPAQFANLVSTPSPKEGIAHVSADLNTKTVFGNSLQQQWVTNWIAKRYRVAPSAADMLVSAAYSTAKEIKLDPLLILSVMAIESGFNPFAESPVGAQGLMQVMSKVHSEKFEELGGVKAALNPVANIKVGSLILKDYVTRGGSVEAGLKLYVGAGAMDSDSGYGSRVLAEYQRLKDVASGKKVPIFTTSASAAPAKKPQDGQLDQAGEQDAVSEDDKTTKTGHVALL